MSDNPAPIATPGAAASTSVKTTNIYVAATSIPVGSAITADMVATQPWPEHLALASFVKAGADNSAVVGMVARAPFQQNEPIIASKLANPNDPNFLAGELPAGMRVVTIAVNEVDGLAGFIFPGDHIDIIYTHDVDGWETPPQASSAVNNLAAPAKVKHTIAETLLTNVKVVAVDQRSSSAGSTDKNGNLVIPKSASLMVSQTDAQRVRLAQKTGTLSLVLRSLADREASDPLILTKNSDISQEKAADIGSTSDDSVRILRGAPRSLNETSNVPVERGAPSNTLNTAVPSAAFNPPVAQ